MTRLFLFLFACSTAFHACSQPTTTTTTTTTTTGTAPPQPKPAVYASAKAGWLVDVDEAYEVSTKSGKPILANFTGSDWCGWCKRLDADVFSKPEFQTWAKKNVVLLELDFPRRFQIPPKNQSQNVAMQNALGVTGYPTIWVINLKKDPANGQYQLDALGKTGYTPSAEEFITTVDKFVNP